MSSYITTDTTDRQCLGKRSYLRKQDAKRAARQAQEHIGGGALHAYRCGRCRKFHVGHQPEWLPPEKGQNDEDFSTTTLPYPDASDPGAE